MNTPGIAAILVAFLVGVVFIAARGWWRRIGVVCLVGSVAAAGFFIIRDRRLSPGDAKISVGDSQAHVLAVLGAATEITDCSTGGGCVGITDAHMRLVTVTVTYTPLNPAPATGTTGPKSIRVQMAVSQR